jgi:hypothetical protein
MLSEAQKYWKYAQESARHAAQAEQPELREQLLELGFPDPELDCVDVDQVDVLQRDVDLDQCTEGWRHFGLTRLTSIPR